MSFPDAPRRCLAGPSTTSAAAALPTGPARPVAAARTAGGGPAPRAEQVSPGPAVPGGDALPAVGGVPPVDVRVDSVVPVSVVPVSAVLSVDGGRLTVVPAGGGPIRRIVVLLHGAGAGTDTPVLTRLAHLLVTAGVTVARLDMPYRVAGRRAPDRAPRLDAVLAAAVAALALGEPARLAFAGASMGSRVAVRSARSLGARGVLALGFPLVPPGGRPSRRDELLGAGVPVCVVQGERDAFGRPEPDPGRGIEVVVVAGADHSFRTRVRDGRAAGAAAAEAADLGARWLLRQV